MENLKYIINEGIIIGSFQHKQLVCQKILLQHSPDNFLFGDTLQAAFYFGLPMNSFPDDCEASLSNDFTNSVSLVDIVYEFKVLKLPVIKCIIIQFSFNVCYLGFHFVISCFRTALSSNGDLLQSIILVTTVYTLQVCFCTSVLNPFPQLTHILNNRVYLIPCVLWASPLFPHEFIYELKALHTIAYTIPIYYNYYNLFICVRCF